jgi:hypothetical protein
MLRYHHAAGQVLEVTAVVDEAARAAVVKQERRLGIRLPSAVAEWYALPELQELVAAGSNDSHYGLAELGRPYQGWGDGTRDFLAEGLLLIRAENQGVCHWAVPLGEGDDPPVLVEVDSDPDELEWQVYARSFTEYAFTLAWDFRAFAMPHGVAAQELRLRPEDRLLLEDRFHQRPQTYAWPGSVNYRFERPGQRVIVWDAPPPHPAEQTDWWLLADTVEALRDLITQLWRCGELARRLYSTSGADAEDVLTDLRQSHP